MASEVLKLSLLLELKNNASSGIREFIADLKKLDGQGKLTLKTLDKIRNELNKKLKFGGFTGADKPLNDLKKIDAQSLKTLTGLAKLRNQMNRQLKSGANSLQEVTDRDPIPVNRRRNDRRRRDPFAEPPTAIERYAGINERYIEPITQIKDSVKSEIESLRPYTDAAMKLARARSQFKLINLSPDENKRAFAAVDEQIKQLGITTRTEGIATLTDLHTAFGDLGHAIESLPIASKYKFSMEALFGDKFSGDELERQIQNGFKFLELTGKVAKGQKEMEAGFNAITQITAATGGRLTGADFLNMAKTGGPAMQNLSTQGLRNMSAVMQELGGERTGTASMSMYQALVGGMMRQRAAERFKYFGLLDESKIEYGNAQQIKRLEPGANRLAPLMMEDPLMAADRLMEAFKAKGMKLNYNAYGNLDEQSSKAVNEELSVLFQNRTAQRLMSILMTQRGQVLKESGLAANAKDVQGLFSESMEGPGKIIQWEKALERFREQAGGPLLQSLTGLATATQPILSFFADHPNVTKYGLALLIAAKGASVFFQAASFLNSANGSLFRRTTGDVLELTDTMSNRRRNIAGFTSDLAAADSKAKGLGSRLRGLPTGIQIGLTLAAIGFTWEMIQWLMNLKGQQKELDAGTATVAKNADTLYKNTPEAERNPRAQARQMREIADRGKDKAITSSIDPSQSTWTNLGADFGRFLAGGRLGGDMFQEPLTADNPLMAKRQERVAYHSDPSKRRDWGPLETGLSVGLPALFPLLKMSYDKRPEFLADRDLRGANYLRKNAPSLEDPKVMASFRQNEIPKMNLPPNALADLNEMLRLAFPESFATSSQQIAQSFQSMSGPLTAFQQSLMGVNQPLNDSVNSLIALAPAVQPIPQQFTNLATPLDNSRTSLIDLYNAARPVPPSLFGITDSASTVSESLKVLSSNIAAWKPPAVAGADAPGAIQVPGVKPETNAKGGTVMSSGLSFIHTGERITPSNTVRTQDSLTQTLISTVAMMRDRERNFERSSQFVNTIANSVFPSRQPTPAVTIVKSYNQGSDSNDVMWKGPSRAIGGVVERDGMAMVHRGNVITPARVTRGLEGFAELMSLARSSDQSGSSEPGVLNIVPNFGNQTASSPNEIPDFAGRPLPAFSPDVPQISNSTPVNLHVTIEAPLTIQTSGAVDDKTIQEINRTHERQIETLREMVEAKLDPRELSAMLAREMRTSRQRG